MVSFQAFKGSKDGSIVPSTTTRDVERDEVLIKITHCGVCGTDEHHKHRDMVLGHEGVGLIEALGSDVRSVSIGDVVGFGYVQNSCGECKECLTGHDNLCPLNHRYGYANYDQGCFATNAIWKAAFVFKIPNSIDPAYAAPLMCGGATVYHALEFVKPSERVGIIGVGGLGHLAIQFASKMGCEVVVFSSTDSKKAEAMSLGATQFIATKNQEILDVGKPLNHLLVTTSAQPNWAQFFPLLAPRANIYPLTVSSDELSVPYGPITRKELRIQGSLVSPRQTHREMIEFAALHGIKPIIETFPLTKDGIVEALDKLRAGRMRYRGVLVAQ